MKGELARRQMLKERPETTINVKTQQALYSLQVIKFCYLTKLTS